MSPQCKLYSKKAQRLFLRCTELIAMEFGSTFMKLLRVHIHIQAACP